jgi:alanine-glyoxylate transaminase/serine-glyoxylate transaminase/serine-pyruvate transaminase
MDEGEASVNIPKPLSPRVKILMGPGPSDVHPRVLQAQGLPVQGHLDPDFLETMSEVQAMLRAVYRTENELVIPISGTGSAGMEAAIANTVRPGDDVLVCVKGYFGLRICEMVERYGGQLHRIDAEWGTTFSPDRVDAAVEQVKPQMVCIVHAETSTGVLQPIPEIAEIAHRAGALLLMDCVTSLGGVDLRIDEWGVDVAYSGTQKCLGAPPGMAPLTLGPRAAERLYARKDKVRSWYLDMSLLRSYWGDDHLYHHTAPISSIYALHEALRMLLEEGLETRQERHLRNHLALIAGLEAMGLTPFVKREDRLPVLNTVVIPEGADDARVRRVLLDDFGIEIGGGLGDLRGVVWRVGLMGQSSLRKNVIIFLGALEEALLKEGVKPPDGAGVAAADRVYGEADATMGVEAAVPMGR